MMFCTGQALPQDFVYPAAYNRVRRLGLTNLEPWRLSSDAARQEHRLGLAKRYPDRNLIPFAYRLDVDDVACWDYPDMKQVVVIHDFATVGWELKASFPTFYDWFLHAINEMIDFDDEA